MAPASSVDSFLIKSYLPRKLPNLTGIPSPKGRPNNVTGVVVVRDCSAASALDSPFVWRDIALVLLPSSLQSPSSGCAVDGYMARRVGVECDTCLRLRGELVWWSWPPLGARGV